MKITYERNAQTDIIVQTCPYAISIKDEHKIQVFRGCPNFEGKEGGREAAGAEEVKGKEKQTMTPLFG